MKRLLAIALLTVIICFSLYSVEFTDSFESGIQENGNYKIFLSGNTTGSLDSLYLNLSPKDSQTSTTGVLTFTIDNGKRYTLTGVPTYDGLYHYNWNETFVYLHNTLKDKATLVLYSESPDTDSAFFAFFDDEESEVFIKELVESLLVDKLLVLEIYTLGDLYSNDSSQYKQYDRIVFRVNVNELSQELKEFNLFMNYMYK